MSGHDSGDPVGIEMSEVNMEEDHDDQDTPPGDESATKESAYRKKFGSILKAYDERTWWTQVKAIQDSDADFATNVTAKEQVEGVVSRQQAIVEVMVDLLLRMEGITVSQGLVYVLDEAESCPLELLVTELLKRGPDLETKDDNGCTPFLKAVQNDAPGNVIDCLLDGKANVDAVAEDNRKTALHFAAQKHEKKMMEKIFKRGSQAVNARDKDGWTPLHEAAYYGSKATAMILIKEGATVNAKNDRKRTPLHMAAEQGHKKLIEFLLGKKADATITDLDGNAPVDLAAKRQHGDAVRILIKRAKSSKKDNPVKKILKQAFGKDKNEDMLMTDVVAAEKIKAMTPHGVISMLKSEHCGGDGIQFLKEFAKETNLKVTTRAIMDQFVLGKKRGEVLCDIIDADQNGNPPGSEHFDESTPSLLDVIVETNNKELAQHPAIRTMLDHKWKTFGRRFFMFYAVLYAVRMLFFGLALLIAARPDLDNAGCYRDGWDYFRGICEGISILFFLFKIGDEVLEMISLRKMYLKDSYNFLQLLAAFLPLLIIPFRAATAWCASTGDGYCVDPTRLPNAANMSNSILDINQACITASSVQWIVASLAYMANAVLVLEFLVLNKTLGVYVRILKRIVVEDILKFSAIFIVALYIFVGSFYLALRAGIQNVDTSTGAITSDLELFRLQTLYPWHVVFSGFRILIEAGGIFDGDYFDDDNGTYTGYQWFSIVMYLAFLFTVIVVLLNLLIAQMSTTYEKVQDDVEGNFALARARIISRLQKGKSLFCVGKTHRTNYYKDIVKTDLTEEELKQDEQGENAEEKVALMEQKTDWLKETTAEIIRKLQERELSASVYKSEMEQKVHQVAAELTKRQVDREDLALQYKSDIEEKVDHLTKMTDEVTKRQLEREDTALQYKSLIEQKVKQMEAELTRRQQEREDSAQQIKRLMEQKIDRLTEMTTELTRRLLGWEGRGPTRGSAYQ